MRLPAQPGERLDRTRPLTFTFEGATVEAFEGDTIASALYAGGRRVFSRSFKYHRPRGLLCCTGSCPNCLMQVDGAPGIRACIEPARAGAVVRAQNVLGSLDRDALAVIGKIGGPFTPVGFYYRTMIRPRWAWPYYEKVLRNLAGLGRVDRHGRRTRRFDTEHRRTQVLVIGGSEGGVTAARAAAAAGEQVVLVDEGLSLELGGLDELGIEVVAPARAIGIYEGGLVPVDAGNVLLRFRAERIVVATGSLDQPLVFPGNDLVGVMLPNGIRRLVREWALRPGERAVVIAPAVEPIVDDLRAAGTEVARVFDLNERPPKEIVARGRKGRLASVRVDGETVACDLLVMSSGRQPAYSLLAQAGARIEYDAATGIFVPRDLPANVEAAGSVAGTSHAVPNLFPASAGKRRFVCLCEDVTTKDVRRAIAEGFDSLELAKRYTTVTMGPCQGRLCHLASVRLYARETGSDEAAIGTTTARPPWSPVTLGLLAGRGHEPVKHTSLHRRHEELGARMMWAGAWRRVHSYGDPAEETRAVHRAVGVIDVSTLGKLVVSGPDAVAFLERLYPNRFVDLKPGRIRYGVLGTDAGRIMDDGTIGRLSEQQLYVTTTSTGAEAVLEWFEWWNAVWRMDVEIVDVTGALAAVNVAGPNARELLGRLTELDVSPDGFRYLDLKEAPVAGTPCLLLRIGFVGELGYEIHCPSPLAEHLWDTLLERGADLGVRPFGLEAQRILRLEKQHIIVGQDTDSESNAIDAGMPWIVKLDKEDFVGKWALEHLQERGPRERLVGFELDGAAVPAEGSQVVVAGRPAGRVTSARWSDELQRSIGLAWVPPALAEEGSRLEIRLNGSLQPAVVRARPFFDPEGTRLRS
ncbi:MAG: 2Fe-2S iron-sulfur cluster-binding protein [Gaiellaceae bacterium MAG52_C11]|nr:2Fe-2S iron-sulfur cluster-binding protein [Candidatus Gaiellasilicea maunaloa]